MGKSALLSFVLCLWTLPALGQAVGGVELGLSRSILSGSVLAREAPRRAPSLSVSLENRFRGRAWVHNELGLLFKGMEVDSHPAGDTSARQSSPLYFAAAQYAVGIRLYPAEEGLFAQAGLFLAKNIAPRKRMSDFDVATLGRDTLLRAADLLDLAQQDFDFGLVLAAGWAGPSWQASLRFCPGLRDLLRPPTQASAATSGPPGSRPEAIRSHYWEIKFGRRF